MKMNYEGLIGTRHTQLEILGIEQREDGRHYARCRCDCGKLKIVRVSKVVSGHTQSCGCRRAPHGMTGSPTYRSWTCMKARCTNPKHDDYADYGGRGITVCDRWLNSFEAFFADMGERPVGKTLDREDSNGHYEPGNVRWATTTQQNRNRRSVKLTETDVIEIRRLLALGGRRGTKSAIARQFGIAPQTLNSIVHGKSWR